MGTNLKDMVVKQEFLLDQLEGKTLVIDSFNFLYQFLSTIRMRDGNLLKDSHGNITSHLVGLFSRTANLIQRKTKLIFVFDGPPPRLKQDERERRKLVKLEAEKRFEEAKKLGREEEMRKYAARTSVLTDEMIDETKKLITAFGLPIVQAPCEGEAQAAVIAKEGKAFAAVSEDYDSLLFGTPKLIRNLSIAGKRRKTGKATYTNVMPEIIDLKKTLSKAGINQDQLIMIAILVGTDYDVGGVKGIGPKNALKLVKQYKNDFNNLFKKIEQDYIIDFDWQEIFDLIKGMPVTKDYSLKWRAVNAELIRELLCDEHDFSEERVDKTLELINPMQHSQKGLGDFL